MEVFNSNTLSEQHPPFDLGTSELLISIPTCSQTQTAARIRALSTVPFYAEAKRPGIPPRMLGPGQMIKSYGNWGEMKYTM